LAEQPTAAHADEQVSGPVTLTKMLLDDLLDKRIFGSTSKARAKKIYRLSPSDRNLGQILSQIISCYKRAKHWDDLSPVERITLELKWTDLMLELLSFGNSQVMRSLRYRLREQSPEEDEETNGL
jgi:hypothetical protein